MPAKPSDNENWRRDRKKKVSFEEPNDEESGDEPETDKNDQNDNENDNEEIENDQSKDPKAKPKVHPFREVPPVAEVPIEQVARAHNKKAQRELRRTSREDLSFQRRAPVERDTDVDKVVRKILDTDINVSAQEFSGVAPLVREKLRKLFSRQRIKSLYVEEDGRVQFDFSDREESILEPSTVEPDLPFQGSEDDKFPTPGAEDDYILSSGLPGRKVFTNMEVKPGLPLGALVIPDPVACYFEETPANERKRVVVKVAAESLPLRVLFPLINGTLNEESVMDGGSQIVAMAKDVAMKLGLSWDPDVKIHLQSANGEFELSEGLARNVSFKFNDIVCYLQVHVIDKPAYKVLLGRPFDALLRTELKTNADGTQELILQDPVTGHRAVVPTYDRNQPPRIASKKPSGFQSSMI